MAAQSGNDSSDQQLKDLIAKLITANHILHYNGVLDAYGHISVRNPQAPTQFLLARDHPPALVSSRHDIAAYHVEDASAVDSNAPKGYVERYIHSEIYKRYADVNAVIHSHNGDVLPYSITSVPLRPVYHMAGVVGSRVPVFDIRAHYKPTDTSHTFLISNMHLGAALAAGMSPPSLGAKVYNFITSSTPDAVAQPEHSTILMRGHGFSCAGASIEEAVFRAIFTCQNARMQSAALQLQATHNLGSLADRLMAKDQSIKYDSPGISYLTDQECKDTWGIMQQTLARPWKLWCAEVASCDLYKSDFSHNASDAS